MKIDSLKDLEAVIKLCRKTGIEHIIVDGVELNLGPVPIVYKAPKATTVTNGISLPSMQWTSSVAHTPGEDAKITVPDQLSDEEMLFYSVQGNEQ